jgi:fructose-1-phosphate kinase PfkB-like protein
MKTSIPPELTYVVHAASRIIELGVKEIIITLGDKGSFYMDKQKKDDLYACLFRKPYGHHSSGRYN